MMFHSDDMFLLMLLIALVICLYVFVDMRKR